MASIPNGMGVIYAITHAATGRRYVGQSIVPTRRWAWHRLMLGRGKHTSAFLQRMWNKHGADEFQFSVLETCSAADLTAREQFWMDATPAGDLLNGYPAAGSPRGSKASETTRAKMRAAHAGRPHAPEHVEKVASAHRGRKRSEEAKANMRAAKAERRRRLGLPDKQPRKYGSIQERSADPAYRAKLAAAWINRRKQVLTIDSRGTRYGLDA